MITKNKALSFSYRRLLKPLLFAIDAERVHNGFTKLGESLENSKLISWLLADEVSGPSKKILGIEFSNPVGLAAGFDYDGHLAKVMKQVGFGFNTVGTVTAKSYEGNPQPRLVRLPKSKSILVNKGFKSSGALAVAERLDKKDLTGHTIGISVGSTNIREITTIQQAIDDYVFTFNVFKNKPHVKYFELNISCPNTALTESFTDVKNFTDLTAAVMVVKINQPIFVKMPNEIMPDEAEVLVSAALKNGIRGFIFSNLVKNRHNTFLDKEEMRRIESFRGGFSGLPTFRNSSSLISHIRRKFGSEVALIGCGGIFSPSDAVAKIAAGADLVQLITGMIYQGPQLINEINQEL